MQNVCFCSRSSKTQINALPLIDLNPNCTTCIYSTFLFVHNQAVKLNIVTPCVTFGQSFWLKTVEIISATDFNIVCIISIPQSILRLVVHEFYP